MRAKQIIKEIIKSLKKIDHHYALGHYFRWIKILGGLKKGSSYKGILKKQETMITFPLQPVFLIKLIVFTEYFKNTFSHY